LIDSWEALRCVQGIVASGFAFPLMSWCLRKRGPLYVAMFGPLIIVFVAVLSSIFLDETLHLGMCVVRDACALLACCCASPLLCFSRLCSVLGAVLIVAGLYMVLWGKAREAQEKEAARAVPTDEELGKESAAPAAAFANGETK
jgi:drug/metabolite transporter (DMT)-like permease